MPRYLLSLILIIAMAVQVSGQSLFWTEKFSTPEGWTLEDNWRINGGLLYFDWNPTIYNFDQSATSPFIQLDEHVEDLIIFQSLEVYNPTENEVAEIIVIVDDEETIIWDYALLSGNWGNQSGSELSISLQEFAGEIIQLKFRTFGETTFNWSWWQVHDIKIIASYDYDLTVSNIEGPKNIDLLNSGDWVVEVSNNGFTGISNYTVNLIDSKSGNVIDQIQVPDEIESGQSKVFGLSWSPATAYNTLVYGQVVANDDQFSGNNLSSGLFLRIEPEIDYNILVWNNDNGIQSIICPEQGDLITPATGLIRAMDDAGLDYDLYTYLPTDISSYDMIFTTMGNYCLS